MLGVSATVAVRVAIAVAIVTILAVLVLGAVQCSAGGGQYVRGLLWMECVR